MSHQLSFLFLNGGWNSVPSRNGCCVCGVNAIHSVSFCLCNDFPQLFHESAFKVHIIHCHSLATLAPVCLLCSERDLVSNTPCMVASLVRRHSSHPRPCHFAHTRNNQCSLLRTMERFECTVHIACFHFVVTPFVSTTNYGGCLIINSCQCQPIHPSLVLEGQSRVYHSQCILASSISLSVLACLAKCWHCVRRSESGMALGMMSLQSSHLTYAW